METLPDFLDPTLSQHLKQLFFSCIFVDIPLLFHVVRYSFLPVSLLLRRVLLLTDVFMKEVQAVKDAGLLLQGKGMK